MAVKYLKSVIFKLYIYPHFFNLNRDEFNDSWIIVGLSNKLDSKIYIFDQQWKINQQIEPNGDSWNV